MAKWTKKEDLFLIRNYNNLSYEKIGIYLDRSTGGVSQRAKTLGLNKRKMNWWTDNDSSWLVENYKRYTNKELAEKLNRCVANVNLKMQELGLIKYNKCDRNGNVWTDEKLKELISNYSKMKGKVLAEQLNIDYHNLVRKANALGLKRYAR